VDPGVDHVFEPEPRPVRGDRPPPVRPHRVREPKPERKDVVVVKPPEGVTRDAVTTEWMATRREYAAFKSKNGSQLEKEYTDLVVHVQYNRDVNLADTLSRIQSFRRKIRE
ncbi:MAG: hypothetical protein M3680_30930, partial [Myxococcota bacterium]|nr:hypothetical protein [Myxococcota bacterium]